MNMDRDLFLEEQTKFFGSNIDADVTFFALNAKDDVQFITAHRSILALQCKSFFFPNVPNDIGSIIIIQLKVKIKVEF